MSLSVEHNNKQYGTAEKIAARARLHQNYTQAEIGWFEWVARQLPFREGARILEIGCGPGWFWTNAKIEFPANMELTLTDMSTGMVDEAERRCRVLPFKHLSTATANAEALPFADDSFDLIIAMHMLYHVPDQRGAIAEMYRAVRPGGFVAITTNDADNLAKLYELATAFGGEPHDPAGIQFSYARASGLMGEQFGNVQLTQHQARLRITSQEDVFLALTSYPPGENASPDQLAKFRSRIAEKFAECAGILDTEKKTGLLLSQKNLN